MEPLSPPRSRAGRKLSYYGIEVSSGQPDGNGGWATPSGAYTLTVREL